MIERNITLPEMILWTGTRVALGVGVGMLVSRVLSKDAMKAAGLALTVVGGFTTIPLAISIVGKKNVTRPEIRSVAKTSHSFQQSRGTGSPAEECLRRGASLSLRPCAVLLAISYSLSAGAWPSFSGSSWPPSVPVAHYSARCRSEFDSESTR